jgi:hypothetical protein
MKEIRYQLVKINVPERGTRVRFSADTDKMYKQITGLYVSVPDEVLHGSTIELKISDKEIFPEDFEVKMISSSLNVSPNERFYDKIQEEASGNRIEGRYNDSSKAISYPYTALLYVRLEERTQ